MFTIRAEAHTPHSLPGLPQGARPQHDYLVYSCHRYRVSTPEMRPSSKHVELFNGDGESTELLCIGDDEPFSVVFVTNEQGRTIDRVTAVTNG